jgi:poly-gamma-glutamate synthesis protein (capsule biosynthesis protein)
MRLKSVGLTHIGLGNNHILNFGADGLASTKRSLAEAGLPYFGAPDGSADWQTQEFSGIPIAFVGYNEFATGGKERAITALREAKRSDTIVILFAHWGKEYAAVLPRVRALAHEFVEAGADVIVGTHPHIVQERESYRGKTIYYSLGNLFFDQYFESRTMEGLLVEVTIAPDWTLAFREHPVRLAQDGATTLLPER